jgi:DNA-binding NarL/FixJ family response regulator
MIIPAQEVCLPMFFPQPEHGKCILIIEDEAFVRSATCELLRWLEFEVLEARNAAAARDIFGCNPARIDVVFCDITLPDGSGVELCRKLSRESPDLRVVLTSGYPLAMPTQAFEAKTGSYFLKKPYSVKTLLAAFRKAFAKRFPSHELLRPRPIPYGLQNLPG